MKKMLLAFQFLTIIPLRDMGEVSDQEIGGSTVIFPLVGFIEGILLSVLAFLCLKVFPAELTNALLVLAIVIMNGGLHLDGLADTFDAVASRGDLEKKLLVMKDSSVGPMGVIAIVMVLLLKYVLLNAIFFHSTINVYITVLIIMPVVSRWAMVPAAYHCTSARKDGLGRMFLEHTGTKELLTATVMAVLIILLAAVSGSQYPFFIFCVMFALPVIYFFIFGAAWFFKQIFGGMTGDSFGAINEIVLLIFLVTTVIWLQKFI
jgi:adenosylcobinamide-GDP ribazoletransferase